MISVARTYVTLTPPVFFKIKSLIGEYLYFTPFIELKPTELSVKRSSVLEFLNLPLVCYDMLETSSGKVVGYGFQGTGAPEVHPSSLLFRHSKKSGEPVLLYKDENINIYHCANSYTLINRPFAPKKVEDILVAM